MTKEQENTKGTAKNKKNFRQNSGKYISRFFIGLLILFFLSFISIIVITQTSGLRKWSGDKLLTQINKGLKGRIEFSDYKYKFFGGLEIYDVRVLSAGDTLAYVKKALVDFEYKPLFNKKAKIQRVIFDSPQIKLLRSHDSTWNFDQIAEPKEDTTVSEPSDWVINLKKIRLKKGELTVYDSTIQNIDHSKLNFNRLRLQDIDLHLSARFKPAVNDFRTRLKKLSFRDINSGFQLKDFIVNTSVNESGIKVNDFKFETEHSDVNLSAQMTKLNIFDTTEVKKSGKAEISANIEINKLSPKDVNLLPDLPFTLGREINLSSSISGRIDSISVEKFDFASGKTSISLNGKIEDMQDTSYMSYYVNFTSTQIHYSELGDILPSQDFSQVPDFILANLAGTKIEGYKDSISAYLSLTSGIGRIKGTAGISTGQVPSYKADVHIAGLDPAPITKSDQLSGSVNADIAAEGYGTHLNNMKLNMNFNSQNSHINGIKYYRANINAAIDRGGIITLDTIDLVLNFEESNRPDYLANEESYLRASGFLNMQKQQMPDYEIDMAFNGLDLAYVLEDPSAPQYFSGNIRFDAKGFELDSLEGSFYSEITEALFGDRALFPFNFDVHFIRPSQSEKSISIDSDFLTVDLKGDFDYDKLIPTITNQMKYLGNYIRQKSAAISEQIRRDSVQFEKITVASFPDINFDLEANIKDISSFSIFVEDFDLNFNAFVKARMIAKNDISSLVIDSIDLSTFDLETPDMNLTTNPVNLTGAYIMNLVDSVPTLEKLDMEIRGKSDIHANDVVVSQPYAFLRFNEDNSIFEFSSTINNQFLLASKGSVSFKPGIFDVQLDSLYFKYNDDFSWQNTVPILADYSIDGLDIRRFILSRENAEKIYLSGSMIQDGLAGTKLAVRNFPIRDLLKLMPQKNEIIDTLSGNVDSLVINIDGKFASPRINMSITSTSVSLNKMQVGNIAADFSHEDAIVSGNAEISNINGGHDSLKTIINIGSLPIDLSLSDVKERFHDEGSIQADISAKSFPLVILSPFIQGISDFRGSADVNLSIGGYYPDRLTYNGNINIPRSSLVIEGNNMHYFTSAEINIETDKINLKNITLKNTNEDLPGGKAKVYGTIELKDFQPEYIDIKVKTKRFKLLTESSRKALPTLYGDFVIATGKEPINFSGTMEKPSLTGDVNILRADLTLPEIETDNAVKSNMKYIFKQKGLTHEDTVKTVMDSIQSRIASANNAQAADAEVKKEEENFGDLINYDLDIKILGRFFVRIDLFALSQLTAEIGMSDPSVPIRYVKERSSQEAQLYGSDLLIEEGSKMTIIKTFNANGKISFPTASLDNPGFNIEAVYEGTRYMGNETQEYKIKAILKGTKNNPNINFTYSIEGDEVRGDSSEIATNALMLLMFGKTKNESTSGEGSLISSLASDARTSGIELGTSYLLTQVLGELGSEQFQIKSADIDLGAEGDIGDARLKITGTLFGARVTLGGTVQDLATNNEITIEVPLGTVLKVANANLSFSSSHNVSTSQTLDQKIWEAKFKLGGSW